MILASASPRRAELLSQAGFEITIEPADIDESRLPHEHPLQLVERLATGKAHASRAAHGALAVGEVLLAADTIVWEGTSALGKPKDPEDAKAMLQRLSGKTHSVSTGVCLIVGAVDDAKTRSFVETTNVTFYTLSDDEIDAYVNAGEPMDKAGAYGIQGGARLFVSGIDGDYSNVVGLPVARVVRELSLLLEDPTLTARLIARRPATRREEV